MKTDRPQNRAPQAFHLKRNGWMPNNQRLPVLLYQSVLGLSSSDPASACERLLQANSWPPQWRNGIYSFHHYHSTAHEVLGVVSGNVRVVLGGEGGAEVTLRAGDLAVLPAGTGHCRLQASADLLVIGAYPPNQHWDICREAPSAATLEGMLRLPFPHSDPISGSTGSLLEYWK